MPWSTRRIRDAAIVPPSRTAAWVVPQGAPVPRPARRPPAGFMYAEPAGTTSDTRRRRTAAVLLPRNGSRQLPAVAPLALPGQHRLAGQLIHAGGGQPGDLPGGAPRRAATAEPTSS